MMNNSNTSFAELIKIANSTSRSSGASAKDKNGTIRAIVPRYVAETIDKQACVLDFGAGKTAESTKHLRSIGFNNVTAYDFGQNVTDIHDVNALTKKYDVVFGSNVINVSASRLLLFYTICEMRTCVDDGGTLILNYPSSPRKLGLSTAEMKDFLQMSLKSEAVKVAGTSSGPTWSFTIDQSLFDDVEW